ncbi:zinc-ribbon domain-containing protein [Thermodesulfobacteriota bacterium]
MKIQCPKCKTSYRINDDKIPETGAKLRCKKCQEVFKVEKGRGEEDLIKKPVSSSKDSGADKISTPSDETPKIDKSATLPSDSSYQRVDEYIKQGDQDAAAKFLLDLIEKATEVKDFPKAEELLEKMYEATPMALTEVVKATEIIEHTKSKAIDQNHLAMWSDLYNTLETNEVNEVYFAMKKKHLSKDEVLFKQGENNSTLYFVEQGELRVSFFDKKESSDIDLTNLSPGNIVNVISFLTFSITTAIVTAAAETELKYLEKDDFEKLADKFPGIENKLTSFCLSKKQIRGLIQTSGKEPRAHKRLKAPFRATVQLLDDSEEPIRMPIKVQIYDISRGGASYLLKQSRKDEARRLLESTLILQIVYSSNGAEREISRKGKVVAVRFSSFDECSVHIKFHDLLDDNMMEELKQAAHGL